MISDGQIAEAIRTGSLVRAGILPRGLTLLEAAEELQRVGRESVERLQKAGFEPLGMTAIRDLGFIPANMRRRLHDNRLGDETVLLLMLSGLPWSLQERVFESISGSRSSAWWAFPHRRERVVS